jgi:transcriptional regulator with XRE-family HTH domain
MLKPVALAHQLISAREQLSLTQVEVAELAKVSLRTIRSIEAGSANPGLRQLNQILDAVGLTLVVLQKHEAS